MVKEEKLELETFNPDEVFEEGAAPADGRGDSRKASKYARRAIRYQPSKFPSPCA